MNHYIFGRTERDLGRVYTGKMSLVKNASNCNNRENNIWPNFK